jgi:hypothetical protein
MMNPRRTGNTVKPGSSLLWPKVLGLFAIAFAAFFVMFVGYDLLTSLGDSSAAEIAASQQQPIVIDPKISEELAKALVTDQTQNLETIVDPFSDRAGLSGTAAGAAVAAAQASSQSGTSKPSVSTVGGISGSGSGGTTVGAPLVSGTEATRSRYNEWLARITAYGDMPLDPRVFAIEDLLPVGIVDGGNGNQEVMFYSEAAGRTVSFMVGTSFFDGRLSELRPEGVVFSSFDGRQPIRMRSWARALKTSD